MTRCDPNGIGELIRKVRHYKRVSQKDVAELAGVSHNTVSTLESGKNAAQIDTIVKVFRALELDVHVGTTIYIEGNVLKLRERLT